MDLLEQARAYLWHRALAYKRIFLGHGTDTDEVLTDLARFCRANESTYHPDPRMSDILCGRREVWTRLMHHLKLTDEQLWDLYGNKRLTQSEPKELDHG
jgi:hypothetical protein